MNDFDIHNVSRDPEETGPREKPSPPCVLPPPPPCMLQFMTLLSMELAPSKAVRSLIHGTKLENAQCSIKRSWPPHPLNPWGIRKGGRASW